MAELALLVGGTMVSGRYRVGGVLGQGGMGAVYRVEDTKEGGEFALKTLRKDLYDRDDLVKRFEREAHAAARIGHPSIAGVHAFGNDETLRTRFMVQELLRGTDVSGCLNELGSLSPLSTVAIALPVMDALIAAHEAGIVHRDIKPENVFLHETDDGTVVPKVIDFGIAKVIDGLDLNERTATGMVFGTPWYMSPEQALGDSSIDARTDVWSVGTMLYEMLCGTLPFGASNPNAVMAQIIYGKPTPLKDHLPNIAADLEAVVHRAIERDFDRRFRAMAEFREALAACELWKDVTPAMAHGFMPRPSSFDGISDILPAEFLQDPEERLGARRSRQASRRGFPSEVAEPRPLVAPTAVPAPEPPPPLSMPPPSGPPKGDVAGDDDDERVPTRPLPVAAPPSADVHEAEIGTELPLKQRPPSVAPLSNSEVTQRRQRVDFIPAPTEPPWMLRGGGRWWVIALVILGVVAAVAAATGHVRRATASHGQNPPTVDTRSDSADPSNR